MEELEQRLLEALGTWGPDLGDEEGLAGPEPAAPVANEPLDAEPTPKANAFAEEVLRGMLAGANRGRIAPLVVGGQDPFLETDRPTVHQCKMYTTRCCVVELQQVACPYLGGGKLPCPAPGCCGKLESKGPRWDRVRLLHGVGTENFVLAYQYLCQTCNKTTFSTAPELHALLRGDKYKLGFALDRIPFTFTARGGIDTEVLRLLTTLMTQARCPSTVRWGFACCLPAAAAGRRGGWHASAHLTHPSPSLPMPAANLPNSEGADVPGALAEAHAPGAVHLVVVPQRRRPRDRSAAQHAVRAGAA